MMKLRQLLTQWRTRYVALPLVLVLLAAHGVLVLYLHTFLPAVLAVSLSVASFILTAGLAWGLSVMAGRAAERALGAGVGRELKAGDWVLQHTEGKAPLEDLDAILRASGLGVEKGDRLLWALEEWLHKLRETAEDPAAATAPGEMERDLELAKEFQQAYLNRPYPKIPEVHVEGRLRLEFYHRYEPALALGGDFYDLIPLGPDCAGVFIADVMGHGTRSALITSILRTLIGDLQHTARNARHFLTELNNQFCGMLKSLPSPLFASAYYFVPDTTARVATYSSAGHPAPFLVRSHLQRISRLEVPPPRGSALGLIPNERFTGGQVRLSPGDTFILFTDGLYEAHNAEGEEFGIARIEAILKKLIYRGSRAMVDGVMDALRAFVGSEPVRDDICVVAVEVTDKAVVPENRG